MPSGAWALLYMYGEPTSVRGLPCTSTSYSLTEELEYRAASGLRQGCVPFERLWLTMALQAVSTGRPPKKGR